MITVYNYTYGIYTYWGEGGAVTFYDLTYEPVCWCLWWSYIKGIGSLVFKQGSNLQSLQLFWTTMEFTITQRGTHSLKVSKRNKSQLRFPLLRPVLLLHNAAEGPNDCWTQA